MLHQQIFENVDMQNSLTKNCGTTRSLASAYLVDWFRNALNSGRELRRVYHVLQKMSEHPDAEMRLLLVEKLAELSTVCFRKGRLDLVGDRMWPLLLPSLRDKTEKIRKTGEDSLLFLISNKFFRQDIVNEEICFRVAEICKSCCYATTIALVEKMIPEIGKEVAEKHFLDEIVHLCSSQRPAVRDACAKVLRCLCTSTSTELTDHFPIPPFLRQCREMRGYRPEEFTPWKSVLAPAFVDLLSDTRQSVRAAAYGFLEVLLARTLADPGSTTSNFHDTSRSNLSDQYDCESRSFRPPIAYTRSVQYSGLSDCGSFLESDTELSNMFSLVSKALCSIVENGGDPIELEMKRKLSPFSETSQVDCHAADEPDDSFNTFRFWRTPLPPLEILEPEPESLAADSTENGTTRSSSFQILSCIPSGTRISPDDSFTAEAGKMFEEFSSDNDHLETWPNGVGFERFVERVVDCFGSSGSPLQGEAIDIAQDCAFCVSSLAVTLGPKDWPYLKNSYKCLSTNLKLPWGIRRTLVSGIHKLAFALGEETASRDLTPIFESFMKDLDEVKVGALEHLAEFLEALDSSTRNQFLPRLKEFLGTEFDWNWRYRKEFGKQLGLLIKLYGPQERVEHLEPLATQLLCDKVAAVREEALLLFLNLIQSLSSRAEYRKKMLSLLSTKFAEDCFWRRRQVFVLLCSEIAKHKAVDHQDFCSSLLDHLLHLGSDKVPNVSLCVARCLSSDVLSTGYIGPASPHHSKILKVLEELQRSPDPDVRYFASLHEDVKEPENGNGAPQREVTSR